MEVRGRHQRALLISLAVNENRVVPAEALIPELWGEDPPGGAANALQAHISRLRRLLGRIDQADGGDRLAGMSAGYQLRMSDDDFFDAAKFLRTLSDIRRQPDLPPEQVNRSLREALAAWRGPAFGGFVGGPICQAAAARYEESRMAALEVLYDNELRLGNHAGVIAELSELVESDSLNERLCEQLMVALYRAGRQTDALSTYHRMRRRLDDKLGVEPSPTLRLFERAILEHDPMLHVGADFSVLRTLVAR